jgi:hypothetical protein
MRTDENPRSASELAEVHARRRATVGTWLSVAAGLALVIAGTSRETRAAETSTAADDLLRLVPPSASLVLTIEGLRDKVRTIGASRLIADLRQVPAVKSWLASEKFRHLERSCAQIEIALGVKLPEIRDELLGDAAVLVLRLPPGDPIDPSQARGLLLLRAHDPALLARLISAVNKAQRDSGELKRVDDRQRGDTTYHVREFPDGSGRPAEWYVVYPDGTFAFSNSQELIWEVVDRKPSGPNPPAVGAPEPVTVAGSPAGPGLGESPRLIAVRRRLPERPLARLYVDPRSVERLLAQARPSAKPGDIEFLAMLKRHLAAVEYAGAALVWRSDAIVVHAVETLDASRTDGWLRRWAGDSRPYRKDLLRVPRTALAVASAHVDLLALREALYKAVPEADHQRLRNLEAVLSGLMLGDDLPSQILPAIGPGVMAYLDAPSESPGASAEGSRTSAVRGRLFPLVVVVDLSADRANAKPASVRGRATAFLVSDAVENALHTLLAVMALDEKRGRGRAAVVTRKVAGATVMTLDVPIPFAFAVDRSEERLILGTSSASVARYLEGVSESEAGALFRDLRAAAFADYETFVCLDLEGLTRLLGQYREQVARNLATRQNRPAAEVEGDLEHMLALARLFRAAFVASRIEPDASAIQRNFGVILKDASRPTSSQP